MIEKINYYYVLKSFTLVHPPALTPTCVALHLYHRMASIVHIKRVPLIHTYSINNPKDIHKELKKENFHCTLYAKWLYLLHKENLFES